MAETHCSHSRILSFGLDRTKGCHDPLGLVLIPLIGSSGGTY